MSRADYQAAEVIARQQGITLPDFQALERGGLVGAVTITDCVPESDGKYGFTLADAIALPFFPMNGRLSFFQCDTPTGRRNSDSHCGRRGRYDEASATDRSLFVLGVAYS